MWRYGYDELGRLCSKGVPGSVREYYTYDNEDRVITVTRRDEFTEISYDSFGRVTAKYITIGSGSRTQIESHQYDSYSSAATTLIGGSSYTSGPKKGLETWTSYAVTDGQGGFSGTASTAYAYDALGRLTRSVTQYADGHKNSTVISYDFAGNPTSTVVTGLRPGGGTTDVFSVTTTYDTRERPSSMVSVLTVGGVEKARNTTAYSYDALGRQSAVSSGPNTAANLLESEYGYTLQQWTSSISTALDGRTVFSETLGYDSPSNSLGGPSYTGLITRKGETWSIPTSSTDSLSVARTEDYVYDYAARLSGWDDSSNGENISYDARGNITSRSPRHGSGGTVTLTYTGDRLATRKVGTAAAVSFAHDSFARMTTDAETGLSITYNAFNLPEAISSGNTLQAKYTYLSDGTKISALDASGTGLVYRGPFTYRRSSGGTLAFESAPFDRGRLTEAGIRYHVTDHLGSVRAVINGNASTTTYPLAGFYSVNDFAPFGTKSTSSASSYLSLASTGSTVSLRDGFTGQEDQGPDFGVGYSDFGARQYSSTLSRWLVPDPMGEKYYDVSPYAYCAGNPVNRVDIKGKADFWLNGQIIGDDGVHDQRALVIRTEALTKEEIKETTGFIKANSGSMEAFKYNDIAYRNSIEIESSVSNRQAMVTEISKDNGKGGTDDSNNREYGGSIQNGRIVLAEPGPIANPKTDAIASIDLPTGVSTFHSHPSGTIVEYPPANTIGGSTTTYSFIQLPSGIDISNAGTNTHYVFGRSSGNVYIYTSEGVQAIIPMKYFVTPKDKR